MSPVLLNPSRFSIPTSGGWSLSPTGSVATKTEATSSSSYTSGAITAAIGEVIFLAVVLDNAFSDGMAVSTGPTKPAGETNSWTLMGFGGPGGSTYTAPKIGLWCIRASVAWSAFSPAFTFNNNTGKVSAGLVFTGGGSPIARRSGSLGTLLGVLFTNSPGTFTDATPLNGDLCIGFTCWPVGTFAQRTADSDTTNGSWSAAIGSDVISGRSGKDLGLMMQWKIVNADGSQTYDVSNSAGNSNQWIGMYVLKPT